MSNEKTAKEIAEEYGKQDLGKNYPKSEAFLKEFKKNRSGEQDSEDRIVKIKGTGDQQFQSIKNKGEKGENPIDFLIEENKETGVLSLDSANDFGLKDLNGYIRNKAMYLANVNKLEWIPLNNQAIQKVVEVVKKNRYILKGDKYPQFKKYRGKVFIVAENEINDILRKEKKHPRGIVASEILNEQIDSKQDIEGNFYTKTEKNEVRTILDKMENKDYSKILIWKYIDELSYEKIAEKLEITIKAVERRIAKARGRFREEFNLVKR